MSDQARQERLRTLPAVQDVLRDPSLAAFRESLPHPLVLRAIQDAIAAARASILAGKPFLAADLLASVVSRLERERVPGPHRVINASGVIVHTNLGRAPLAEEAIARVVEVARGYSTLEYDLVKGARGSRQVHVEAELCELLGAEAALVVNNNAAAVMLVLAAFAAGREVIVSRGELVEIGGSFRVPDILRASGARLVEVGTTNRTHARDVEAAIGPQTAMILKVHTSNFRVVGFTAEVGDAELAALAGKAGVPFVVDVGSGMVVDLEPFVRDEPHPRRVLAHADLVTFSGDKLLGGPQAGIVAGKAALVTALRAHPLARALRIDKLSLAALAATVRLALDPARAGAIPVVRMIREPAGEVKLRAEAIAARIRALAPDMAGGVSVTASEAAFGGGSVPGQTLPSFAVRIAAPAPDALEAALRAGVPAVVARVHDAALLLDARTVSPAEVEDLATAVVTAMKVGNAEKLR